MHFLAPNQQRHSTEGTAIKLKIVSDLSCRLMNMQEVGVYELGCTVRVDEYGFFIYWKSDGKVRETSLAAAAAAATFTERTCAEN